MGLKIKSLWKKRLGEILSETKATGKVATLLYKVQELPRNVWVIQYMSYDVIEFTEELCVFSRSNPSILCVAFIIKRKAWNITQP